MGIRVDRAAGATRFDTAALLAARAGHVRPEQALLVDGAAEDAWASGFTAAAHALDAPLLLANGQRMPEASANPLGDLGVVQLVCGPRTSGTACDAAQAVIAASARP